MRRAWVVEDNDSNFELVEFLLSEAGWEVDRAGDSAQFSALLDGDPPDVVLLDMHLPDVPGLDLPTIVDELARDRSISDATYARAVGKFGEQGVIDTLGIVGYYSMLAMVLNTARTPAKPALAPMPR